MLLLKMYLRVVRSYFGPYKWFRNNSVALCPRLSKLLTRYEQKFINSMKYRSKMITTTLSPPLVLHMQLKHFHNHAQRQSTSTELGSSLNYATHPLGFYKEQSSRSGLLGATSRSQNSKSGFLAKRVYAVAHVGISGYYRHSLCRLNAIND